MSEKTFLRIMRVLLLLSLVGAFVGLGLEFYVASVKPTTQLSSGIQPALLLIGTLLVIFGMSYLPWGERDLEDPENKLR